MQANAAGNGQDPTPETLEEVAGLDKATDLVLGKLQGWFEQTVAMLPNLLVAVLIVVAFALLAKLARKLVANVLDRVMHHPGIARLIARIIGIAVLVVGVFIALGVLNLDKTLTSLLAGAGVVGLALAFAFQDLAANFMSGIFMSIRRPFTVGDLIETNDTFGTVKEIDLRSTVLRTPQGQRVLIPNKEIFENKLVNFTADNQRRVDLEVGVSYGDDLEKVRRVTAEAVSGIDGLDPEREVEVFYTGFGGSSIDFVVRFWLDGFSRQVEFHRARSAAIVAIKKAFDGNDIAIPFPIRTLDFGVKGGEHVSEAVAPLLEKRGSSRPGDDASPQGGTAS